MAIRLGDGTTLTHDQYSAILRQCPFEPTSLAAADAFVRSHLADVREQAQQVMETPAPVPAPMLDAA